ncbi:ATP-binding protein [Flavobacterium sp. ZB4R12]|uniref:ATP-binding protein n=1 Tax=Flavobacterium sp. ZB4R12 TaxID=3398732 RepID=UPI003AACCBC8
MKEINLKKAPLQRIVFFLILILGMIYLYYTWTRFKEERTDSVLQIARSIEAALPKGALKILEVNPSDINKPEYQTLKNSLKAIIRVNPKASFAYLYTQKNGKIYFMVDSEPESSEDYSPPGQEYTEADEPTFKAINNGNDIITEPSTDRWGTWVSAYIPIRDKVSGKTIAVYGMDFDAKSWNNALLFEVFQSSLLVLLFLITSLFLFKIMDKNKILNYDIINRKIEEKKLQDALLVLKKKNDELDQFAYIVSHDLKAPLRAIYSLSEWIIEDLTNISDETNSNFKLLQGRILRMENLINGILEYSRIGTTNIELEKVDLHKMLEEIVETIVPNEGFEVSIDNNFPIISAEKILMHQIFSNLIGNAVKYNDKPIGKIECTYVSLPDFHQFTIKDNGPGIPKKYQEKVFGVFQTILARDIKESTGIGLSIVKKIIEGKLGSIHIESDGNYGSSFIFTIPKKPKTIV